MKITDAYVVNKFGEKISFTDMGKSGDEVHWLCDNRLISKYVLDKENHGLSPCISPCGKYMIIVFGSLNDIPPSYNAAIFNADGSVRRFLIPPLLLSDKYIEYEKKEGKEALKSIEFLWPTYFKGTLVVCIRFNYDWYEIRELDPDTGKFGKCFGATRQ